MPKYAGISLTSKQAISSAVDTSWVSSDCVLTFYLKAAPDPEVEGSVSQDCPPTSTASRKPLVVLPVLLTKQL